MMHRILAIIGGFAAAIGSAATAAPSLSVDDPAIAVTAAGQQLVWFGAPVPDEEVYAAAAPDVPLSEARPLTIRVDAGHEVADAPAGLIRPYFFIRRRGSAQGVWLAGRVVPLAGAHNFRDLGGYATAAGRHVRWNRIYRSNMLAALSPQDMARLDRMNIVAIVDLRTDQERARFPTAWPGRPANIYTSPKPSNASLIDLRTLTLGDAAQARATMIRFYSRMPDLYRDEYRAFFLKLVAGETPLIVHCTAGKDRTGLASALVLAALGVPRATILQDFELTETLMHYTTPSAATGASTRIEGLGTVSEPVRAAISRSDPAYIAAALDSVDREYGSVHGYLRAIGFTKADEASLRAELLD